ncbi:hypothetical protein [Aquimarina sp. AU474]|uniref:hypothetical protein n=1 Tax=Aquimarina sp. AU474 TaxID=2108529 RepID=UPI001F2966F4|nr:hypothetical protein [Aquimarina sp. AU474]
MMKFNNFTSRNESKACPAEETPETTNVKQLEYKLTYKIVGVIGIITLLLVGYVFAAYSFLHSTLAIL